MFTLHLIQPAPNYQNKALISVYDPEFEEDEESGHEEEEEVAWCAPPSDAQE